MRCHRCGSGKVEADTSSGTTVCVNCGEVLEENTIVSEVAFQELSGGKTVLQGAFAGESGRISSGGPFGRGRGKEGQEQAIDNGRQKIARLAHALRLPERYRESAQRYYNLAVVHRFTRGRKSDNVAAVCLYIVCRNEQSSQMLIDFSDLLQTNVFILGATFLKLMQILCLQLPLIDPSIYISRFAAAMDFGEYTQRVAQDAVRLVQRMDRDWIRTGRRPAGICGACLLIAARINGFRRTTREMIYVAKVADATIQKRLKEFGDTESAQLTIRDFRTIWLEGENDPPAFAKSRKHKLDGDEGDTLLDGSEDEEEDMLNEEEYAPTPEATRRPSILSQFKMAQAPALKKDDDMPVQPATDNNDIDEATQVEALSSTSFMAVPITRSVAKDEEDDEATQVENNSQLPKLVGDTIPSEANLEQETQALEEEMEQFMNGAVKASEELAVEKKMDKAAQEEEEEEDGGRLSDLDDDEIDAMLLNPDEVKNKTAIWFNANKEYLDEMAAKARRREMDRKNGVYSRRGKSQKKKKHPPAATPAEAAKQLMTSKKLSKKINQAVFDDMFESAESIARIKEKDILKRTWPGIDTGLPTDTSDWDVVEESGDAPEAKKRRSSVHGVSGNTDRDKHELELDDDDDEMDSDDMADDERLLRQARKTFELIDEHDDD